MRRKATLCCSKPKEEWSFGLADKMVKIKSLTKRSNCFKNERPWNKIIPPEANAECCQHEKGMFIKGTYEGESSYLYG